ncbi:hypothetical protein RI845_13620 [Thalassotalea nanhaiensis]|uniref:Uncharacterized protein n=1 Tax=Thalassotalea nanhaiensis TaxID=3065648 RepID=A0ABY9TFL5_9GAMM|nr:hypothetical protein RI845_13620 [Colwelliaceae bacterium SQ345]
MKKILLMSLLLSSTIAHSAEVSVTCNYQKHRIYHNNETIKIDFDKRKLTLANSLEYKITHIGSYKNTPISLTAEKNTYTPYRKERVILKYTPEKKQIGSVIVIDEIHPSKQGEYSSKPYKGDDGFQVISSSYICNR